MEKSSDVVLYVGNLVKGKGLEILLKAFARCKQEIKHLKLWIVGDGYLRSRLELLAQKLGISKDVTFFGRLTHDELRNIYNLVTVTILPSEKESFGLVLVESMACGTPVVATVTEGSIEIVKDEVNGLLVPQYDEEAISEAIYKIVSDRSLRQIMSENARRYAVEYFSWEKIRKRLDMLYRSLLAD
jgi:glycosyltransferase involved in cell wall biosynthesis